MAADGPYRKSEAAPRYLCIVCYAAASMAPGTCARCGAPMQSIADSPEIVEELRRRAKIKKDRPERLQTLLAIVGAFITAVVVDVIMLVRGTYDVKPHGGWRTNAGGELFLYLFLLWMGFCLVWTYALKWTGAFRRSIEVAEKFNPDAADAGALLAWLGVRVDDKQNVT